MKTTEIYKINIEEISCTEFNAAYFLMSPERQKKCSSLIKEEDKKLCIAADMLLRTVLSDKLGIPSEKLVFAVSSQGKTYLQGGKYHFSISHSGKYAAVAVNESHPVGIDIEKIRPLKASVIKHIFSDAEKEFVFGLTTPRDGMLEDKNILERFFRVWTYKEAYVKMTGEGITDNIRSISYDDKNCYCEVFDDYCLTVVTDAQ